MSWVQLQGDDAQGNMHRAKGLTKSDRGGDGMTQKLQRKREGRKNKETETEGERKGKESQAKKCEKCNRKSAHLFWH